MTNSLAITLRNMHCHAQVKIPVRERELNATVVAISGAQVHAELDINQARRDSGMSRGNGTRWSPNA